MTRSATSPMTPTRPPPPLPPAPRHPQMVRFRPDRARQPQLLRQLEERHLQSVRPRQQPTSQHPQLVRSQPITTFKPYQLKPKRGKMSGDALSSLKGSGITRQDWQKT